MSSIDKIYYEAVQEVLYLHKGVPRLETNQICDLLISFYSLF